VVVDGADAILAVGPRAELRRRFPTRAAVEERADGVLLPGLVNAHCHLELSALAGEVPGGDGLIAWTRRLAARLPALTPARQAEAAERAAAQAVGHGTAAMGDVGNGLCGVPALSAAGLRGSFFHELVGSRAARPGGALADAARELEAFLRIDSPSPSAPPGPSSGWPSGVAYVVAPHAPYSVGPELLRQIFDLAARNALPTTIHVAEDPDELALLRDGTGRWPAVLRGLGVDPATRTPRLPPLAYLAEQGAFNPSAPPPLLVHMVHAGDDDRRRAHAAGATAVLCPRSNLHITGDLPDVPALLAAEVKLALGTDSLASAPDLSPWGEIAVLRARFPELPASLWLDAATRGGAEALQLAGAGTLNPGQRPGIIEIACDDPAAPLEALVRNPRPAVRWRARA
jgi:cytosine/adenosine deaminase-related metal-dependent hydrolase